MCQYQCSAFAINIMKIYIDIVHGLLICEWCSHIPFTYVFQKKGSDFRNRIFTSLCSCSRHKDDGMNARSRVLLGSVMPCFIYLLFIWLLAGRVTEKASRCGATMQASPAIVGRIPRAWLRNHILLCCTAEAHACCWLITLQGSGKLWLGTWWHRHRVKYLRSPRANSFRRPPQWPLSRRRHPTARAILGAANTVWSNYSKVRLRKGIHWSFCLEVVVNWRWMAGQAAHFPPWYLRWGGKAMELQTWNSFFIRYK